MKNKVIHQIFIMLTAFLAAAVIINMLIYFFYYRVPGWFDRDYNVTNGIWRGNKQYISMEEGYSIHNTDKRGFFNPNLPLKEDNYVLLMGSSNCEGKGVMAGERYSDILNSHFSQKELTLYNIAIDAHFYDELVKGFKSAVEEFPQSSAVVLEIKDTKVSPSLLEKALKQREYSPEYSEESLEKNIGNSRKLKFLIKENIPLIYKAKELFTKEEKGSQKEFDTLRYAELLNETMALIRSEYKGKIIIVYHPETKINENGSMEIVRDSETYEIFRQKAKSNNIDFIDTGDAFLKAYNGDYTIPYGFSNTALGEGHLNKQGHKIIADILLPYIKEAVE